MYQLYVVVDDDDIDDGGGGDTDDDGSCGVQLGFVLDQLLVVVLVDVDGGSGRVVGDHDDDGGVGARLVWAPTEPVVCSPGLIDPEIEESFEASEEECAKACYYSKRLEHRYAIFLSSLDVEI